MATASTTRPARRAREAGCVAPVADARSASAFATDAHRRVGFRLGRFDRCHEAIAHTRNGFYVLLPGRLLAERLPKHRYVVVEVVFFDDRVGPDRLQQLLLGHEPSGILDQHAEGIEHLQPQGDSFRAA